MIFGMDLNILQIEYLSNYILFSAHVTFLIKITSEYAP